MEKILSLVLTLILAVTLTACANAGSLLLKNCRRLQIMIAFIPGGPVEIIAGAPEVFNCLVCDNGTIDISVFV